MGLDNKIKKELFLILVHSSMAFFLFLPMIGYAAQPVITSVTGTVQNRQILTITGSNMIDEDKTNWDSFFTSHENASGFEGASPAEDGYIIPNSPGMQFWWEPVYDGSMKLLGNQSIHFHTQGSSPSILTSYVAMSHHLPKLEDIWVRFYAKWIYKVRPYSHIKMIDTFGGPYQSYFQPSAGFDWLVATAHARYASGTPKPFHNGDDIYYPFSIEQDRWYEFELHFRNKSGQPYIFDTWMDGKQITWGVVSRENSFRTLMLGIINQRQKDSRAIMDHWWDGFAVSSSRIYPACTIEISNNPAYGEKNIKYQEPVYLSDSLIRFRLDVEGLGKGPFYLWVTNNRQERSKPYTFEELQ